MGVSASLGFCLCIWGDLLGSGLHLTPPWETEPAEATSTLAGVPLLLLMAAVPTGPALEERASRSVSLHVYFQVWGPVLPGLPHLFTA